MLSSLFIFIYLSHTFIIATKLSTFKQNIENKLIYLRDSIQQNYQKICEPDYSKQSCPVLSYDMCNTTSQKQCLQNFPTHAACVGIGAYLSTYSSIRYPNHVHQKKQYSQLDYHFTCATAIMEQKFWQIGKDRDRKFSYVYIASKTGAFRCYPGFSDIGIQGCADYDSRVRHWYVSSVSGFKNILIVLDSSAYMNQNQRLGAGIAAVKAIINTAGPYDYIRVIHFNEQVNSIYSEQFHINDQVFKEAAVYEVAYITTSQAGSNFQLALKTIGQILDKAKQQKSGAPCDEPENIIFFMSSGHINKGSKIKSQLKYTVSTYSERHKIKFFTYALGKDPQTQILQQISCSFGGMMFKIQNQNIPIYQILTKTQQYYSFIYSGYERTTPTWSAIYEDTFGFGRMITVTLPAYYTNNGFRQYLGLICIDIVLSQLQAQGIATSELQKLNNIQYSCQNYKYTPCQMQKFRFQGNLHLCKEPTQSDGCISNQTICRSYNDNYIVIKPGSSSNGELCCSISVGGLIGTILGVVCLGLIIALFVYRHQRRKTKKLKRRQKKIQILKKTIKQNRKKNLSQKNGSEDNKVCNDSDILSEESISKRVLKKKEQQQSKQIMFNDKMHHDLFFQQE